jgi:hypothetical protein
MLTTDEVPSHPLDLQVLVETGDRACARGDQKTLQEVARVLSSTLASPLEIDILTVERLAGVDFDAAAARWEKVSRCFRDWIAASLVHRN